MALRIVNEEQFRRSMTRRADYLHKHFEEGMRQTGRAFVDEMGMLMSKPSHPVQSRSGRLRDSFDHDTSNRGNGVTLRIYSAGAPYAAQREFGGTIKPRNKKFLTVPLPDAQTKVGVTRGSASMFKNAFFLNLGLRPNTPSDMQSYGSIFLVERKPTGDLAWLFQLRKRVEQRGGLGFFDLWRDWGRKELLAQLKHSARKALR